MMGRRPFSVVVAATFFLALSSAFQSDEIDEEFGLEGARSPDLEYLNPIRSPTPRTKPGADVSSSPDSRSVQFALEHALGDSGFSPAGIFTARIKSSSHGRQTLTKLRFKRNTLTDTEKEAFRRLLKEDGFYTIRLPSNVLSPPGRDYVISSVKARCLPRDGLDEHFVINMEGANILSVNYGSAGACPYPRLLKYPAKWTFNSYSVLNKGEEAERTPTFAEELLAAENAVGEDVKPPEKSFWAKYVSNI
ncbi:hypothetical protein Taro_041758 [Colocasia esculenta]|uniref:ER membrane protein complex subunit 10 n=1 Tax=Colocasia esculenta TaxID=4460 RepID=A0A843WCA4_COLES|nr:hypothetical protein [Colocasia esculenta]